MPSLQDLKTRIDSVKSTRKITSAMKMVAAAKLRKAQDNVEASRPYSELMSKMLSSLAASYQTSDDQPIVNGPKLLVGTGKDETHLLVVFSSDRGLCGGFNTNIAKLAKQKIRELNAAGKKVYLLSVNRKATELLKAENVEMVEFEHEIGKTPTYKDAKAVGAVILELFEEGKFDCCSFIYNKFQSALVQTPTHTQLIPFETSSLEQAEEATAEGSDAQYEFEPNEEELLAELLPSNMTVQMYHALLENAASEHGSRMTAMDNATRNAGDMINKLTLQFNRTRQALITKELIEIISGAEAL